MDAHVLYETGWSPEVLDAQPMNRVRAYLLYRQVRNVRENGGELSFGDEAKPQPREWERAVGMGAARGK